MKKYLALGLIAACLGSVGTTASADTLDQVRQRGKLLCGISQNSAGFALTNEKGEVVGIDASVCYAVAAAVLKDSKAVQFVPVTSDDRFLALQGGRIDVLAATTTWTLSRDMDVGVDFAAIDFYDGQGFLVGKDKGITKPEDLNGAVICMRQGTTSVQNLSDYFNARKISYTPLLFEQADEVVKAYDAGRCDAYSIDRAALAGDRLKLKDPDAHVILDAVISKEPLAVGVRQNDSRWSDVVRWTFWSLLAAEELGVTSENAADLAKSSKDPATLRLLGGDVNYGEKLGLDGQFGLRAIQAAGNYGEMFDKMLGKDSKIGLSRGPNELWTKGGLMYSPPWR